MNVKRSSTTCCPWVTIDHVEPMQAQLTSNSELGRLYGDRPLERRLASEAGIFSGPFPGSNVTAALLLLNTIFKEKKIAVILCDSELNAEMRLEIEQPIRP